MEPSTSPPPPDPGAQEQQEQEKQRQKQQQELAAQRSRLIGERGHEAQYHALAARGRQIIDQALSLRHFHPSSTRVSLAAHLLAYPGMR